MLPSKEPVKFPSPNDAHLPPHCPESPSLSYASTHPAEDNHPGVLLSVDGEPQIAVQLDQTILVEPDMKLAKKMSLNDAIDIIDDPSSDVYYYERDSNTPGVCVESGDGMLSWSPVKLTRTGVKAASDTEATSDLSEDAELNSSDVTNICFDKRSGVPGFEIETNNCDDDAFWVPVAYRT